MRNNSDFGIFDTIFNAALESVPRLIVAAVLAAAVLGGLLVLGVVGVIWLLRTVFG